MNRAGAALVLALLVILVLEGVVLGTVYLSVQERRIAGNGVTALRLRLAAESAARAAAATWPAALDSLPPGARSAATVATNIDGLVLRTVYQRIDSGLILVFAEAAEPPPRVGRARAALLFEPPLLPEARIPHAALTAGAGVKLRAGALLTSTAAVPCPDDSINAAALQLPGAELLERDDGAALEGPTHIAALPPEWTRWIASIAAALQSAATDSAPPARFIATDGDLTVPANAAFRGVILVGGVLVIETGAVVEGIVLAAGSIELRGTIRFSACAARDAVRAAGVHRPRPYAPRTSIPAF